MESLSDETWDAVIAGTSLPQSLLALALSKCDLKVLHVDKNQYYGGVDAGLSLDEAERWIKSRQASDDSATLTSSGSIGSSRAYTISLRPQIIYAKSKFLPTLVSSQIHSQLEFQAVGSFWVHAKGTLQKIPSNREDVFADDTISVRDKRRLMGLLRYVLEDQDGSSDQSTLEARLQDQFKLPENLRAPVQALTLSTNTLPKVQFSTAMARLKLHLTSTGYFGPGLAAVMAKYGGNAEIAQVACRAGAVGGFVYLLGQGIQTIKASEEDLLTSVTLSNDIVVKTKHIVGMEADLPEDAVSTTTSDDHAQKVAHQISIISNPFRHLFAATSENGPIPAVTIVLVDDDSGKAPVYLQVHSEDTGECPTGQCIIYASCLADNSLSEKRLSTATNSLLSTCESEDSAQILWSISFTSNEAATQSSPPRFEVLKQGTSANVLVFPSRPHNIAFDDTILENVKAAWEKILGDRSAEYDFLRFEERKEENDD